MAFSISILLKINKFYVPHELRLLIDIDEDNNKYTL